MPQIAVSKISTTATLATVSLLLSACAAAPTEPPIGLDSHEDPLNTLTNDSDGKSYPIDTTNPAFEVGIRSYWLRAARAVAAVDPNGPVRLNAEGRDGGGSAIYRLEVDIHIADDPSATDAVALPDVRVVRSDATPVPADLAARVYGGMLRATATAPGPSSTTAGLVDVLSADDRYRDICLSEDEAGEIVANTQVSQYACFAEATGGVLDTFWAAVGIFVGESLLGGAGCTGVYAAQCALMQSGYRAGCCQGSDYNYDRMGTYLRRVCQGAAATDLPDPALCAPCFQYTVEYENWGLGSCPTGFLESTNTYSVRTNSRIVGFVEEPASNECRWGRDLAELESGERLSIACSGTRSTMFCGGQWNELRNPRIISASRCDPTSS